ncbi:YciI family protein [Bacillus alkalicellulosilyticus]|uniref:YciI family protein n=1 Tax=Alkalihalobacterium alkalicellulosilyticum TaxID=1912214 RepID=UPI000998AC83|nr:YciI family protein [Bacillus alkalicellulosilyticus]
MSKHFAAILKMKNPEINAKYRPAHLEYLQELEQEGKIFAKGPFIDGTGGMVIYIAESIEEAKELAEKDPYIIEGVRTLELHEWGI